MILRKMEKFDATAKNVAYLIEFSYILQELNVPET